MECQIQTDSETVPLRKSSRRTVPFLILGIGSLYLILWLLIPKPSFWGLDSGFKYQGAVAFSQTGSITVPYRGVDFDPRGSYRPMLRPFGVLLPDGRQAPVFSVVFMLIAGVLFRVFGAVGPYLLPLFGGWLSLVGGWFLWKRMRPNHSPVPFLTILTLGTPLLFYSLTLWEHSLAMAMVLFCLGLILRDSDHPRGYRAWEPLVAGFIIALGSGFRTELILFALVMTLSWKVIAGSFRGWIPYIVGLALGLLLCGAINFWQTGTPLPLHVLTNLRLTPAGSLFGALLRRVSNLYILIAEGFKSAPVSLILLIPILLVPFRRWLFPKIPWMHLLAVLTICTWLMYILNALTAKDGISYTLHSGGLLWVSPVMALSLIPISRSFKSVWGFLWLGSYLCIALVALITSTSSGVHWGPRFILSFLPMLAFIAAIRLQYWWNHYAHSRFLLIVLLSLSFVNQAYSYNLLLKAHHQNADLNRWAVVDHPEPALSTLWWLPGDCALLSDKDPWFISATKGRIRKLISGLRSEGIASAHIFELPPYLEQQFWWSVGVEQGESDYFLEGGGELRRTRLKIIP